MSLIEENAAFRLRFVQVAIVDRQFADAPSLETLVCVTVPGQLDDSDLTSDSDWLSRLSLARHRDRDPLHWQVVFKLPVPLALRVVSFPEPCPAVGLVDTQALQVDTST